jgi:sigma-E factor negative regulatory protein RseB
VIGSAVPGRPVNLGLPRHLRPLLLIALLGVAAGSAPSVNDPPWRAVLERAASAAASVPYAGEALWVSWAENGDTRAVTLEVSNSGSGRITMASAAHYSVTVDDHGSRFIDHQAGWLVPLPGTDPASPARGLDLLERKYRVVVAGSDELLDRACTRVDVFRRDDRSLRERLWLDDASGLLLRRETYDGEERRERLVTYLSLDLHPRASGPPRGEGHGAGRLEHLEHGVVAIASDRFAALREAGWVVPSPLPAGYQLTGGYGVSLQAGQPLQLVYSDGLYAVSLFEQRGALDPASLPRGARTVDELGGRAYEWPGATPRRMVWEAQGTIFSLVGDAPRHELLEIARSLPQPVAPPVSERLRRGFRTLWSWLSW